MITPDDVAASWTCRKRDRKTVPFDCGKIRTALAGCFREVGAAGLANPADPEVAIENITWQVVRSLQAERSACPGVEHIQRLVIRQLWTEGLYDAAEAYQNYREHHRKQRELATACVFGRRASFKPFDYPDVVQFKEAIQHSFWLVTEWDFVSDVHDFKVNLSDSERSAITNTLLAISQIEVAVKLFWVRLGDRLPRPEFVQVGVVFGDSEVRHSDAYAHLLGLLGLEDKFAEVLKIPALAARVDYLSRNLRAAVGGDDRAFVKTLALFSLFVENVSLFSQFAVMKSFAKHRKCLNNVDNVVQATQREEQIHALFGVHVVNLIRAERPDWFGPEFYEDLAQACREALEAETGIVDWIFEAGELPFIPKASLVEFIKDRFNEGMIAIGGPKMFDVDPERLSSLRWFIEELHSQVSVDFFHKRSTNYTARATPVTAENLF